jgi:hypothetical protein
MGVIPEGSTIVCTLTGNGLKDPETAISQCSDTHPVSIDASLDAVKKAILDSCHCLRVIYHFSGDKWRCTCCLITAHNRAFCADGSHAIGFCCILAP